MNACCVDYCERSPFSKGLCKPHYMRQWRHGDPLAGGTYIGAGSNWIRDVALKCQTDDCVIWPFGKTAGYGYSSFKGGKDYVHRIVCREVHGDQPAPKMEVAHNCGNPVCCNPRHLRWATSTENNADKKVHGTLLFGEAAPNSRHKEADVLEMRRLRKEGKTFDAIGKIYGMDAGSTRKYVVGKVWKHLPL